MTSKEQIKNDLMQAVKIGDVLKLSVLRMVLAAIRNKEIEKRTKLSRNSLPDSKTGEIPAAELEKQSRLGDEEVLDVLIYETKKRKEAIVEYEKGNRHDLAEKEKAELEVLRQYLPEELSDEELKKMAAAAVKEAGAQTQKDFGKAMSVLMPKIKGRVDGTRASQAVKELLI